MTKHKAILNLSIAAIALFVAATPSLAQAQSEQSGKDTQSSIEAPIAEQTLALNREFTVATRSRVASTEVAPAPSSPAARPASRFVLSASTFKASNNFTSAESSRLGEQRINFSDAVWQYPAGKRQFRGDDDESASSTKRISFVPSRGQKLPE